MALANHRICEKISITPLGGWEKAFLLALILVISMLSWWLIEQPLRSGIYFWPRRFQRIAYGGVAAVSISVVGAVFFFGDGFPKFAPQQLHAISQQSQDRSPMRKKCHSNGKGETGFEDTCVFGRKDGRHVIVLADSHGAELSYALGEEAGDQGLKVRQITASGCLPAIKFITKKRPKCSGHNERMLSVFKELPRMTVIMTAFYFLWEESEGRESFWKGFEQEIKQLRQSGHKVIILGAVPPHPLGSLPGHLAKLGSSPIPILSRSINRWPREPISSCVKYPRNTAQTTFPC